MTPILYDKKYKANSYAMFIGVLLVMLLVFTVAVAVVDHVLKSDEPLSALFRKDRAALAEENKRLRLQVDSLRQITVSLPRAEAARKQGIETASNAKAPQLGHYSNDALRQSNYAKYLEEKMKFYFRKSEELELFIQNNW